MPLIPYSMWRIAKLRATASELQARLQTEMPEMRRKAVENYRAKRQSLIASKEKRRWSGLRGPRSPEAHKDRLTNLTLSHQEEIRRIEEMRNVLSQKYREVVAEIRSRRE